MDGMRTGNWARTALLAPGVGLGSAAFATTPDAGTIRAAASLLPLDEAPARVIVLGELHGTREAPALAEALVRHRVERGEPVTLALEIDAGEQARIDTFLDISGDADSRDRLVAGPFWALPAERSDGRRSVALLGLLDEMRRLRQRGADVHVLAFDLGNAGAGADERNRRMAGRLREAFDAVPSRAFVVLIGNYHARRGPPATVAGLMPGHSPPVPTMAHLADVPMLRINVTARSGAFWACMGGTCGPRPLGAGASFAAATTAPDPTPRYLPTPDDASGWDGHLQLPVYSVAEPVVPGGLAQPEGARR